MTILALATEDVLAHVRGLHLAEDLILIGMHIVVSVTSAVVALEVTIALVTGIARTVLHDVVVVHPILRRHGSDSVGVDIGNDHHRQTWNKLTSMRP
jgi:hypothetical protein